MPFCPKCRFEYLPEITHCPTCNAALVPERPPTETHSEEDFAQVLLCVLAGNLHARLLQTELAAQGIPYRLQTGWSYDPLLWALPAPPPPLGSAEAGLVAIHANHVDEARARIVYHDLENVPVADEAPEEESAA